MLSGTALHCSKGKISFKVVNWGRTLILGYNEMSNCNLLGEDQVLVAGEFDPSSFFEDILPNVHEWRRWYAENTPASYRNSIETFFLVILVG